MNRTRHDELRRAMRRLGSFGHHDEEEAVLALLEELADAEGEAERAREAALELADALTAAEARAADAERERDEAKAELAVLYGDSTSEWFTALDRERARADKATRALAELLRRYDAFYHGRKGKDGLHELLNFEATARDVVRALGGVSSGTQEPA